MSEVCLLPCVNSRSMSLQCQEVAHKETSQTMSWRNGSQFSYDDALSTTTHHDDSRFLLCFTSLHLFLVFSFSLSLVWREGFVIIFISSLSFSRCSPLGPSEKTAGGNRPNIAKFNKPSALMTTVTWSHRPNSLTHSYTERERDKHAQAHFSLFQEASEEEEDSTCFIISCSSSSCRQSLRLARPVYSASAFHATFTRKARRNKKAAQSHMMYAATHAIKHLKSKFRFEGTFTSQCPLILFHYCNYTRYIETSAKGS